MILDFTRAFVFGSNYHPPPHHRPFPKPALVSSVSAPMSCQIDQTPAVDETIATRRTRQRTQPERTRLSRVRVYARGANFGTNQSAASVVRARCDRRSVASGWVCRALCLAPDAHSRAAST